MKELYIEAKIENLDTILNFLNEYIDDCTSKIKNQIAIVVDEIFSNICHYAYHPEVGDVSLRITVNGEIVLEFEDSGKPYNPLEIADPDITANAEDRQIGGLGIYMVKNIMDSVQYKREKQKNILVIKKSIKNS